MVGEAPASEPLLANNIYLSNGQRQININVKSNLDIHLQIIFGIDIFRTEF